MVFPTYGTLLNLFFLGEDIQHCSIIYHFNLVTNGVPGFHPLQQGCVMPISCPLKQWLQERTSLLHSTLIACLVVFFNMDVIIMIL